MNKPVYWILFVLFASFFVSCARATSAPTEGTPKAVVKIGDMTVEEHSGNRRYPDITAYCGNYFYVEKEPGTKTTDCEVPLIPRMQIDFAWEAKDSTILDSNWSAIAWEMDIDGTQIDLDEFGLWHNEPRVRGWVLDLVNLSPGKHTLRLIWSSEVPVDDGTDIYAPGTYESIVNFTVAEQ